MALSGECASTAGSYSYNSTFLRAASAVKRCAVMRKCRAVKINAAREPIGPGPALAFCQPDQAKRSRCHRSLRHLLPGPRSARQRHPTAMHEASSVRTRNGMMQNPRRWPGSQRISSGKRSVRSWCSRLRNCSRPQRLSSWPKPAARNSSFAWRARPNRETSAPSARGIARRTHDSPHQICARPRCSRATSALRRHLYCRPSRTASHSPFSRTRAGPLYTPPPEHVRVQQPAPCARL